MQAALSWGVSRGRLDTNVLLKIGKILKAERQDMIWSLAEEEHFCGSVPENLKVALKIAVWTSARQGDILAMRWSDYDGKYLRFLNSKNNKMMSVPCGKALREVLDAAPRKGLFMLLNRYDQPYNSAAFKKSWGDWKKKVGIEGLTFHDLRGTAVTRLALTGCTHSEIASFTGHSEETIAAMLEKHYRGNDPRMADNALAKFETYAGTIGDQKIDTTFDTRRKNKAKLQTK